VRARARAHSPGPYRATETCSHGCQGVRPARLGSARLGSLGHPQSILKSASVLARSLRACMRCVRVSLSLSPARPRFQTPSVTSRDRTYRASRKKKIRLGAFPNYFLYAYTTVVLVNIRRELDSRLGTPLSIFEQMYF